MPGYSANRIGGVRLAMHPVPWGPPGNEQRRASFNPWGGHFVCTAAASGAAGSVLAAGLVATVLYYTVQKV